MGIPVARWYDKYVAGLDRLQPVFLLLIRLYWGWQFFLTGKGKLLNLDRTAGFFAKLDIPLPHLNAVLAGSAECFGGLLLLLGLGGRIATVPLIFTMIIAYLTADFDKVKHIFDNPDAFVSAAPFAFMLAALMVLLFGPGPISVDGLLRRLRGHR